ncbi:MAG: VapE family protein [Acutalibacteraceae bacterium]|nr:VapE family protein [Acutalibacteraceae bacterium]
MTDINSIKTSKELFDFFFIIDIVYCEDKKEKEELIRKATDKARELGVLSEFINKMREYEEIRQKEEEEKRQDIINGEAEELSEDGKGNLRKTISNFLVILETDDFFSTLRFNLLTGRPEFRGRNFTNADRSTAIHYIERLYNLKSEKDLDHAIQIFLQKRQYHPIREKIKKLSWDKKERISDFLSFVMGAEDNEYTKECSRLIFHCAIARAFEPGCKCDNIIVLQGKQGNGKTTITQWLAMEEAWYGRVSDIRGNTGIEQIQGKWICEISELLALSGADRQEEAKQYFDRKTDSYRRPYTQYSEDIPRQCIFIGTTNLRQPFKDKTGNRRYFPVYCNVEPGEIYYREKEIKDYIQQCWAEAYELYLKGGIRTNVSPEIYRTTIQMQKNALEDDWREGIIADYLTDKAEVCVIELWEQALKEQGKPTMRQSREIAIILDGFEDWERGKSTKIFEKYKSQKYWRRKTTCSERKIDEIYVEIIC